MLFGKQSWMPTGGLLCRSRSRWKWQDISLYFYDPLVNCFGKEVMPSAISGIAAILLPGGQTVHKTICIPIPCLSTCRIAPPSEYAKRLREVFLFLIDEASMRTRHQFEPIYRVVRDITGNDIPFGGKIFVLGGDFRQTLYVEAETLPSLKTPSFLWSFVKRFRLTTNMRTNSGEEEFKSFFTRHG